MKQHFTKQTRDYIKTIQKGKESCEGCIYYKMIDDDYGRCVRFPPKWLIIPGWFKKTIIKLKYPEVEWAELICGEFKSR